MNYIDCGLVYGSIMRFMRSGHLHYTAALLVLWAFVIMPCGCCEAQEVSHTDHCDCTICPSCLQLPYERSILIGSVDTTKDGNNLNNILVSSDWNFNLASSWLSQKEFLLHNLPLTKRKFLNSKLERAPPFFDI